MRAWVLLQRWLEPLMKRLRRAYRYSELRKLLLWMKGKTLHWALYLVITSLVLGGTLGLHNYLRNFFYVVWVGDEEVGFVLDAAEIEAFMAGLTEQFSLYYGMEVELRERITFNWEYRPGAEADAQAVKEVLSRQVTLVADAVMVTVNGVPVVPVATEDDVETVINILYGAYVSKSANVELLEAKLVEEVKGEPWRVDPEIVHAAEEAASLLITGQPAREFTVLSRSERTDASALESGEEAAPALPTVRVVTVERVTTEERIPFSTSYTYTSSLWSVQSRVATPGQDGKKEVVFEVTRENGKEVSRQKISEKVLDAPVTQVVERGTASVPAIGTGRFLWPVGGGGGRLTQGFKGWSHAGIDIAAPIGTPVLAADSGVVVKTGSEWPMGNYIVLFHGQYYTLYLHNDRNLVSEGTTVSRGQTIAYMGRTGRSTGPHVHFEVRVNDGSDVWKHWRQHAPVNPLNFFSASAL